ncbi:MAG TPA: FliI/YscN family ATPase [Polyangiaceae bacterium LLY-WYZ-15_(1-7)]|nr:flagellum-specific ATP synthase FliI [Myxococcales bacterium]MAT26309.1 flagellum-specific ATP synthase FliI [Sandaracinus sp.]HJK91801.1 FliI/YscN family ATPase [Polyangiaceae bacterium LLY-WYZ-15_(1-7)]MBJ70090.1 flagellum-specific ATP synthase FliI [Sandaracinus sp.]HJL02300.1 FliI/YscN family ATPase [Polyangiaceae bacterium LLY-WYZ-15_(1-7)]
MALDVDALLGRLEQLDPVAVEGRVRALVGLGVRAAIPGARVGEMVEILRRGREPLLAEVVGFVEDDATLMPLGEADGVGPDDPVRPTGEPFAIRASDALLGRVLDGLGRPLDGGPSIEGEPWAVLRPPPNPMTRPRIDAPLVLGVRALDGLLTVGEGQRVGLFAGSGVGKSTLLGQIARQAECDVAVVCLIGERGREVREFLEDSLGEEGLARSVVVCATSDTPALVRLKSAHVATAIAEHFRDRGRRVMLLMDSVTRFARAGREVGLAAGEPPARRGYPPSVFAALPGLLERSGRSERGSITAFYTVLVEGSDMEEPIADEVRGILDGHVILDRQLGARGRWPAIDILQSLSRVMDAVTDDAQREAARKLRELLATYEAKRDLVSLGAYERGSDPKLDAALARIDGIEGFLRQGKHERSAFEETRAALERVVG